MSCLFLFLFCFVFFCLLGCLFVCFKTQSIWMIPSELMDQRYASLYTLWYIFMHIYNTWYLKEPGGIASHFFHTFWDFGIRRKLIFFSLPLVNFTSEKMYNMEIVIELTHKVIAIYIICSCIQTVWPI